MTWLVGLVLRVVRHLITAALVALTDSDERDCRTLGARPRVATRIVSLGDGLAIDSAHPRT